MKFRSFFHPHVVIKYYLLRDIASVTNAISFNGRILDVGCGEKPYKKLFTNVSAYEGIDFKNYSANNLSEDEKPDFFFTKEYLKNLKLPFKNASYDHTVAFQVAEHHPSPETLIKEMTRVTKKNGLILLTVPFIWGLHEVPHDYSRMTKYALKSMFQKNNCRVIIIKRQGSIASTIAMLLTDYLIEFSGRNIFFYVISILVSPIFLAISYVSMLLDRLFPSKNIFLNYLVLAKKL